MLKSDYLPRLKNAVKEYIGTKGEFLHGFYISAKSINLKTTKYNEIEGRIVGFTDNDRVCFQLG